MEKAVGTFVVQGNLTRKTNMVRTVRYLFMTPSATYQNPGLQKLLPVATSYLQVKWPQLSS